MKTVYNNQTIDYETGEVKSKTWITKRSVNTIMFARVFPENNYLLGRCTGAEQSVMSCLLKYLTYETNEIFISKARKAEISEKVNLKISTINIAISKLQQKNIIIKLDGSRYLHPLLYFYGSELARETCLEKFKEYPIL